MQKQRDKLDTDTPCLIIGSLTIMNASLCKYVLTLKILSKITMASSSLIHAPSSITYPTQYKYKHKS
jgi:hypothetical protein